MPASRVTSKTPWHMIWVLDDSGSMRGPGSVAVNNAIKELIDALVTASMGQKPYFKVSVISFGSQPFVLAEAEVETSLDESKVASFSGDSGSTNMGAALDEAKRLLERNPGKETDFEPFVFLFSDGKPDNRDVALRSADKIKSLKLASGVPRLVTIGVGDVDEDLMERAATNQELYKKLANYEEIVKLLPAIGTVGTQAGGAEDVEEAIMKL